MNRPTEGVSELGQSSESATDLASEKRCQRLSWPLDFDLTGGVSDDPDASINTILGATSQQVADVPEATEAEPSMENIDIGSGYEGPVTPVKRFDKRQSPRYNIPGLQITYAPAQQSKLGQLVRGMQQSVLVKDVSVAGMSLRVRKAVPESSLLKLQISYRGQTSALCYAEVIHCQREGRGFHRLRLRLTNQSIFLNNVIAYATRGI